MILSLVLAALAWQQPSQSPTQPPQGPVVVSAADLTVQTYEPQHARVGDLGRLAQAMFGRNLCIRERGAPADFVSNIQQLGDILIVYDVPDYVQSTLARLKELDKAPDQSGGARAGSAPVEKVTWEYTPRYLPLDAAYELLEPLRRFTNQLEVQMGGNMAAGVSNISVSEERRLILVRDSADRVAEIRELLQRLDVPEDQVTITCWLLQGGAASESGGVKTLDQVFEQGKGATGVPDELAANLRKIVPGQSFHVIGFGLLRSSVAVQGLVSVDLADATEERPPYVLSFRPVAYDGDSGSLSVTDCALGYSTGKGNALFSTALVLRGGDYTVIGATGKAPILVAIRVTPVAKAQ